MKSTEFLTGFAVIFLIKNINGQHNALVYQENSNCNNPDVIESSRRIQQPTPTYAIVQSMQDLLNQNENTAELPKSTRPLSPSTQRIQLPPDLQRQSLQVQQYLQLEKPLQLQQAPPLQQPLQLQPQTQMQPLQQSQLSFDTILPLIPLQSQDTVQLQPLQKQAQVQSDQLLQSYPPLHTLPPLDLQQPLQSKQALQTPQPLILQQTLPSPESLQPAQAIPLGFQQYYPQIPLTVPESKNLIDTPLVQKVNNNQPNTQIQIKWQSANPQDAINIENLSNSQNFNIQPLHTSVNRPVEVIGNPQKPNEKYQDTNSVRYYVLSQPPTSPSASTISAPIVYNYPSVVNNPSIQSAEVPYTYIKPSLPNQNTNTQIHYYNLAADSQKSAYLNQHSGLNYSKQSKLPVVLQSQPTAFATSQSSILSATPISIRQAPTITSQYSVSPGYPVGTIVAPAYTRNKSVSTNVKSILPLIFQLLKEKLATCDCNNNCPCDCKNDKIDDKLEVINGYTGRDALSVLDTVSEEEQGSECLREPKNCEEIKNTSLEASSEILEEDGSDEEDFDEEEET